MRFPSFTTEILNHAKTEDSDEGEVPSCFTDPQDTEIPALRDWCVHLLDLERQQLARDALGALSNLVSVIHKYLENVSVLDVKSREGMKQIWSVEILTMLKEVMTYAPAYTFT